MSDTPGPAFFFAYSEENVRQSTQKMAFYNLPLDLKVLILLNFLFFLLKYVKGCWNGLLDTAFRLG